MSVLCNSRIIRRKSLSQRLDVSETTIWRWEKQGVLPPKCKLGPNVVGWLESQIDAWWSERTGQSEGETSDGGAQHQP